MNRLRVIWVHSQWDWIGVDWNRYWIVLIGGGSDRGSLEPGPEFFEPSVVGLELLIVDGLCRGGSARLIIRNSLLPVAVTSRFPLT